MRCFPWGTMCKNPQVVSVLRKPKATVVCHFLGSESFFWTSARCQLAICESLYFEWHVLCLVAAPNCPYKWCTLISSVHLCCSGVGVLVTWLFLVQWLVRVPLTHLRLIKPPLSALHTSPMSHHVSGERVALALETWTIWLYFFCTLWTLHPV